MNAQPELHVVLSALRTASGLSQKIWGDRLGVGRTLVGNWEKGDAVPRADREDALVDLCRELNLFKRYADGVLSGSDFTEEYFRGLLQTARLKQVNPVVIVTDEGPTQVISPAPLPQKSTLFSYWKWWPAAAVFPVIVLVVVLFVVLDGNGGNVPTTPVPIVEEPANPPVDDQLNPIAEKTDIGESTDAEVPTEQAKPSNIQEPAILSVDDQLNAIEEKIDVGDYTEAERLIEQLEQTQAIDDHTAGRIHAIRGNIAYNRGEFVRAEHEYQLAQMKIGPDTKAYASLLMNQAVLWSGKGLPFRDRAIANLKKAREVYQELEDSVGLAYVSVNEGTLHQNDPELARSYYEKALQEAGSADDPFLMGTIEMNIGVTYRRQSSSDESLDQAEAAYEGARIWFERAANLSGQADVELRLAVVEQVRGHTALALERLGYAEEYLRNVDSDSDQFPPRRLAQLFTFKADLHDAFGETKEAEILYKEAISIYESHPDPLGKATTLANYAGLLAKSNRDGDARELLERANEIVEGFAGEGPYLLIPVIQINLGKTYQDIGDNDKALSLYEQAKDMSQTLGERTYYAQALENIGTIKSSLGDVTQAFEVFKEAHQIYLDLQNRDGEARTLFKLYPSYTLLNTQLTIEAVSTLLSLIEEYHIDRDVESEILLGILVQDIEERSGLISYRERLEELLEFYGERDEPAQLGRSHQKLANVEQVLGNFDEMVRHAREAEKYVDEIELPLRITVHTDLAYFLLSDSPSDALEHFNKAFDLSSPYDIFQQRSLALVINHFTTMHAQEIDCARHLDKARTVAESTEDPEIRTQFQGIVDALSPVCV